MTVINHNHRDRNHWDRPDHSRAEQAILIIIIIGIGQIILGPSRIIMIFRIDTRNIDSFVTKHFDCEKSLDLENKFDCDEILLSTLSILFSKILGPTSPKLLFSLLRSISITPFCKECPWGCAENGKNAKVVRLAGPRC